MFEHLTEMINNYNSSGNSKAVLQVYNSQVEKAFIFCIVTDLMCCVQQADELYYMNASVSFKSLNTSITLLFISCAVGALSLELLVTSDKLKITLEKAVSFQ